MSTPSSRSQLRLGTFHAACWMLVLVAFLEVMAVGMALALRRQGEAEPQVVERVVTEYVPVAVTAPRPEVGTAEAPQATERADSFREAGGESSPVRAPILTEEDILQVTAASEAEVPRLDAPVIADPEVERLVEEAREARVRGDMRAAIAKLEDAEQRAPGEPTVLYQSAELFEAVGHYDKAADYYEKVWAAGPATAGRLHELAGLKISQGFDHARKMEGKLTLGRVRQFNDTRVQAGEKIVLTIPVLAAPNGEIDGDHLTVDVFFFDKLGEELLEATEASTREFRWLTEPVDWKGTGEELLQVTYFIPPGDQRDRHLLGERRHFGQIVELRYGEEGELLDHQAWPRTLAHQRNVPESNPLFIPEEFNMDEWNEANPLLPPLPTR